MRRIGLAALQVLALIALLSSDVRAADECGEVCDASCAVCCRSWVLRATCSNGKGVALQGAYESWREARAGADAANRRVQSCSGPGPGACSEYHRCGEEVAVWTAWCSADQTIVRPSESAKAASDLDAVANVCAAQLGLLDDITPKLATFASGNKLTAAASKKASALQGSLPGVKTRLTALRDKVAQMRQEQRTTSADAKKFRKSQERLLAEAASAIDQAKALMADPASVDRTAEERSRKQAEADEAARLRKEEAERVAADAATRKTQAEEAARARKEAAEAAAAEKRSQAEAARAQELDKAQSEGQAALDQAGKSIAAHSELLSAFLARDNITPAATTRGTELARKLNDLKSKLGPAGVAIATARSKGPAPALGKARARALELLKEVSTACTAAQALIDDKSSYRGDRSGPPPSNQAPAEAGCDVLFEPANNAAGVSIAIDNGPAVRLPAKQRVASGRHAITVTKGKASEQRNELILCGRVSRIEVPEPK